MTTLPKTVRFSRSTSTRQSPRHRRDHPEMEPCREVPVTLTPTYLNPRLSGAPEIQLIKNAKYPIPLPPMSEDVVEKGALLGKIPNFKYQDYNLQDQEKFSQFWADQYMSKRDDLITQDEVLAPQEWIEKLAPSGLLNLQRIPHFTRSPELNAIVKVLLSCVHDGYFWLDQKIDLNVDVIHQIIRLIKVGVDPYVRFVDKNLGQKLSAKLTKEHNLSKGTRAYDVLDFQDQAL